MSNVRRFEALICLSISIFLAPNFVVADEIIEDTNIELNENGSISEYEFVVYQDVAATDATGILFNIATNGVNIFLDYETTTLDEGSEWYIAQPGQAFSAQSISDGDFVSWDFGQVITLPFGSPFYLAVNTGVGFDIDGLANRQHFGWLELEVDSDSNIFLLDNAIAYDNKGIIIGENVAVPEPGSWLSLGVCSTLLLRRKRLAS